MSRFLCISAAAVAALMLAPASASAHGFAGQRFFPATIATEDPAAADELALPTVTHLGDETEWEGEFAKRITPHVALSVGGAWTDGQDAQGWQNLSTGVKWQFLTNPDAELMMSAGVDVEWGGAGDADVGAEDTTVVEPSFLFGKGFGNLPVDALKPLAVTGTLSYSIPTEAHDEGGDPIANELSAGLAIEYSLPYLSAHVKDYGLPEWVNQLTPLVEVTWARDVRRSEDGSKATGTVNPGVLWTGRHIQLGAEAVIPMNDESGDETGWTVQLHFFIDDMFPHTLGRPIFGGAR